MSTQKIAERFVDLVLRHEQWSDVTTLPAEEIRIFFDIVTAAGFDPGSVVPGELFAPRRTIRINGLCKFTVLDEDGNYGNCLATGWLDSMVEYVINNINVLQYCHPDTVVLSTPAADKKKYDENRAQVTGLVIKEIERSVPLEPIQLTHEGDFLCELSPGIGSGEHIFFVGHTRDESVLRESAGIHKFCGGEFVRRRATKWKDALSCQGCSMPRILISREDIKTYGDLRRERRLKLLEP